jgi:hypothetical protein
MNEMTYCFLFFIDNWIKKRKQFAHWSLLFLFAAAVSGLVVLFWILNGLRARVLTSQVWSIV